MSTFLELCQTLRQEAGVAGTGPAAVTSQTGMYQKLVNWTARAWVSIQTARPYWKFMRETLGHVLSVGVRTYSYTTLAIDTDFRQWNANDLQLYEVSLADATFVTLLPYTEFRARFPSAGTGAQGRPTFATELDDRGVRTLAFNCAPDKTYTLAFGYYVKPVTLAANTDVPACPPEFHDAIVWKALMLYAGAENVPELYGYAKGQYGPLLTSLTLDQAEIPGERKHWPLVRGDSRDTVGFS